MKRPRLTPELRTVIVAALLTPLVLVLLDDGRARGPLDIVVPTAGGVAVVVILLVVGSFTRRVRRDRAIDRAVR